MITWFYVNRAMAVVLEIQAMECGPEHLFMGGTRRPRVGTGYGFFLNKEEALACKETLV